MVHVYFRRMEVWFWRGRILTSIFCTNRLCLNSSSFWLVATGNCQPTEHSWSTYQGTDAFPQNHKLKIQGCNLAPKVLWKNGLFYRLWVAGILLQSMRRGISLHMKKVDKMLNDFSFPATILEVSCCQPRERSNRSCPHCSIVNVNLTSKKPIGKPQHKSSPPQWKNRIFLTEVQFSVRLGVQVIC